MPPRFIANKLAHVGITLISRSGYLLIGNRTHFRQTRIHLPREMYAAQHGFQIGIGIAPTVAEVLKIDLRLVQGLRKPAARNPCCWFSLSKSPK